MTLARTDEGAQETTLEPFYRSADAAITVYNERWEDVVDAGLVPLEEVALIHDDPPWGINLDTKARRSGGRKLTDRRGYESGRTRDREWAPIIGDDRAFDPAPVLSLARPLVLWGGNHFASRLPDSPSWIWWDKRGDGPEIDNACGELAWTNLGGPPRRFEYLWRGLLRGSHRGGKAPGGRPVFEPHLHPTEKPVALVSWVFAKRAKLRRDALVFVPHMGSGPELAACLKLGLRCIACDVSRSCCEVAVSARLGVVPDGVERGACEPPPKDSGQLVLLR